MAALPPLLDDPAFLRKLLLLVAAAILTGLMVPWVKSRLDNAAAARKQILEAELSRQAEFLKGQIDLLTTFSDAVWAFLFDAFQVSYAEAWEDADIQDAAWNVYSPSSWTHLRGIRAIISKSKRLVRDECHRRLLETYAWLVDYDDQLAAFNVGQREKHEWQEFHQRYFQEAAERIDDAISGLATELRLSAGSPISLAGSRAVAGTLAQPARSSVSAS
jgi:hypothetical protein